MKSIVADAWRIDERQKRGRGSDLEIWYTRKEGKGMSDGGPRDKAGICKEMGRLPQLTTNKETERDTSKLNGA